MERGESSRSLVVEIGATNIRFAFVDETGLAGETTRRCAEFSSFEKALASYLDPNDTDRSPDRAAIAVAGPVTSDRIQLTNLDWQLSVSEVEARFGLSSVLVVNDLSAQVVAVAGLEDDQTRMLKQGTVSKTAPFVVVAPGSGLGVGAGIRVADRVVPIASEAGHQTLTATNNREWAIIDRLSRESRPVSVERVLCGPGLSNLYRAVCSVDGAPPRDLSPEEIVMASSTSENLRAREVTRLFSGWLGTVAGDLALTFGARAGVLIAGGVIPKMGKTFEVDHFADRFVDKGRFRDYLESVVVRLADEPYLALSGLVAMLQDHRSR